MPRDIGNEIVVAIAAIGVLAFALVFAIVLSLSNVPDAAQTATAGVSNNSTDIPTVSGVTPSTESSATPLPVRTSSLTPKPASATPLPVQTEPQNTVSASATPLPVLASSSPTSKPAATATTTIARTQTPLPTLTFTPTSTITMLPASNTSTVTLIPTLTEVPNTLPTVTGIVSPLPTTAVPVECPPPIGWATYTVQRGDTLFSIARQTNSTVRELQGANCLMNVNAIFAGTQLYVPHLPVSHGSSQPPSLIPITQQPGVPASGLLAEGCTNAQARITNLIAGQTVSGVVTLTGSAAAENFLYYKIEVRPDFAEIFNFYSRSETPVTQGTLAFLDTKLFGSGLYWIRLTVLTNTSTSIPPCTIPVYFR
ncbi:MAG: LysM peptidoglycan-binding domain-containing protein [Anaerolineae bacterium]|nr:LysM peptidoglycan-binding domain-containing protein [Anaerolineae bacterium]